MELAAGAMVTPSLRLTRLLGQGGMGSVWVARHLSLDTEVAVKFILPESAADRQYAITRFQREAKAAAKIRSPHCVHIYDHGFTDDSTPYIVMELLRGESLRKRLDLVRRLSPSQVATIVTQVAKALGAAHKLGVVHRDIKPENIFMVDAEDGETFAKVLDFGVARETAMTAAPATATGTVVGTPEYMAPELLIDAKTADTQADLWALSVVAYQALTGRAPFQGDTLVALCLVINGTEFRPPTQIDPTLPPGLDPWFSRAFARDASRRFGSAKELASSLAATLQPPTPDAAAATEPAKTQLWTQDEPARPIEPTPHAAPTGDTPAPTGPTGLAQTVLQQPAPAPVAAADPPRGVAELGADTAAMAATPIGAAAPTPAAAAAPRATASPSSKAPIFAAVAVAGIGLLGLGGWWLARGAGDEPAADGAARSGAAPSASAAAPPGSNPTPPTSAATTSTGSSASAPDADGPMVSVPAGEYPIGCVPDRNRECFDDERPGHRVTLKAYRIMRHEVTVADYQQCVSAGACPAPQTDPGCTAGAGDNDKRPINCVDWHAAHAYCHHHRWRLPTEPEWEAAALGADHPDFPWGPEPASCARTVVADAVGPGCGSDGPLDVGARPGDRSWVGALDLGGNVREWTASDYGAYPGGKADATTRGKVNRGGSYLMKPGQIDTAHTRGADPPTVSRPDLGFRCAADR